MTISRGKFILGSVAYCVAGVALPEDAAARNRRARSHHAQSEDTSTHNPPMPKVPPQVMSYDDLTVQDHQLAHLALEGDGVFYNSAMRRAYVRCGDEITIFNAVSGNGKYGARQDVENCSPIPDGDYTLEPRLKGYRGKAAHNVLGRKEEYGVEGWPHKRWGFVIHYEHIGHEAKDGCIYKPRTWGCIGIDRRQYAAWLTTIGQLFETGACEGNVYTGPVEIDTLRQKLPPVLGEAGELPARPEWSAYEHAMYLRLSNSVPLIVRYAPTVGS